MTWRQTDSRIYKVTLAVAIAGFALGMLSCKVDAAAPQGCDLFEGTAWVALELLRPVILGALRCMAGYISGGSTLVEHLMQVVGSFWPLFYILAG